MNTEEWMQVFKTQRLQAAILAVVAILLVEIFWHLLVDRLFPAEGALRSFILPFILYIATAACFGYLGFAAGEASIDKSKDLELDSLRQTVQSLQTKITEMQRKFEASNQENILLVAKIKQMEEIEIQHAVLGYVTGGGKREDQIVNTLGNQGIEKLKVLAAIGKLSADGKVTRDSVDGYIKRAS